MLERGILEGYGPVDVSADASRHAADALIRDYPDHQWFEGVIGDFERPQGPAVRGTPPIDGVPGLDNRKPRVPCRRPSFLRLPIQKEMTGADSIPGRLRPREGRRMCSKRAYNDEAGSYGEVQSERAPGGEP